MSSSDSACLSVILDGDDVGDILNDQRWRCVRMRDGRGGAEEGMRGRERGRLYSVGWELRDWASVYQ